MNLDINLPEIDDKHDVLKINGRHGLCRSYYQPDELDIKTLEYAASLVQQSEKDLWALDLGCSPYFPQSQRLAKLGFQVDAFDLEEPITSFNQINQQYQNQIHYHVKNLADIKIADLRDDYQIVYSNRCLSFLTYQQTCTLLHTIIKNNKHKARYFLAFIAEGADYAEGYPIHLPLEHRYAPLTTPLAHGNEMIAPVCVYKRNEIYENLLGGLSISLIKEIKMKSGSLKIIFESK